jgi:invasion protein IalB
VKHVLAGAALALFLGWSSPFPAQTGDRPSPDPAAPPLSGRLERFGDWELRCSVNADGVAISCHLQQYFIDSSGVRAAEIRILALANSPDFAAFAHIVTPHETLLTEQLHMAVDDEPSRVYAFSFCESDGCYVRMGLTAEDIQAFLHGLETSIIVVPAAAPEVSVRMTLTLAGFEEGFAALQAVPADADQTQ